MFKFLVTMDTLHDEMLQKSSSSSAQGYDEQRQPYSLVLDHERARPPRVDSRLGVPTLDFRSHGIRTNKTVADFMCLFNDRRLIWGGESIFRTPATSGIQGITGGNALEEDIIHADVLNTFHDTLSIEESEQLFSFLTTSYLRIPLVLNFFSERDRVVLLFDPELQELLRAVLFDGGAWARSDGPCSIDRIPGRTRTSMRDGQGHMLFGTPHGLLANELRHSPAAVLQPMQLLLEYVSEVYIYCILVMLLNASKVTCLKIIDLLWCRFSRSRRARCILLMLRLPST